MPTKPHRKKSKRQNWRTPPDIFHGIRAMLGHPVFKLDVAADEHNALAPHHYDGLTPETDALKNIWSSVNWCNPPFDRTADFILKAIEEASCGNATVMLLTASTENAYWMPAIRSQFLTQVFFVTGRIAFIDPGTGEPVKGNPAGSVVFVFEPPCGLNRTYKWVHRDALKASGESIMARLT